MSVLGIQTTLFQQKANIYDPILTITLVQTGHQYEVKATRYCLFDIDIRTRVDKIRSQD
jgi:hypothetical protein